MFLSMHGWTEFLEQMALTWMHMFLSMHMNDIRKNVDKNSGQIGIPNRILGADGLPGCICF